MKKTSLIVIISLFCHSLFSQIEFEKGYFIDSTNRKVICLIKNVDWKNNPKKFDYKLSEKAATQSASINDVIEFGVNNYSKYIKATVKIDKSSDYLGTLSNFSKPDFVEETVFLLVLEEGQANLYYFEDLNIKRFFYKVQDGAIEPLVYKKYEISRTEIGTNAQFRQALSLYVKCEKTSKNLIERINYNQNELRKYFQTYNQCFGINSPSNGQKPITNNNRTHEKLKFKISAHVNSSSFELFLLPKTNPIQFPRKISIGIGTELEYVFPFNKNKWRFFINPNFSFYSAEKSIDTNKGSIEYRMFELPVGMRYYMFLKNENQLFLNGGWAAVWAKKNQITFIPTGSKLDIGFSGSFFVGAGYAFKKVSAELRYFTPRNILDYYLSWDSNFQKLSASFYYSF